jgi:predicted GTPase
MTIFDTPGLGDTNGVQNDTKHITNIIAGIQCEEEINVICYVHKGSDVREDIYLKYYI